MSKRGERRSMRKGQIQLSFGMIFSIIVIIATIAVAFYVIGKFVVFSRCVDAGSFYTDLNDEVDKAWKSPLTQDVFTGNVPKGVESVCFGNIESADKVVYKNEYQGLKLYKNQKANVFIYPSTKACGNTLIYYNIEHAFISEFFCVSIVNRELSVKINKGFDDSLVTLSK